MLNSINSHPVFKPNQVLTDKQLNGIVEYLGQQTRLTRFCAIGMGIICGFDAHRKDNGILVSGGCGITSEGYLMHAPELHLTHFREVSVSPQWFGLNSNSLPYFTGVLELEPAPNEPTGDLYLLTDEELVGKVLVLVLESTKHDNADLCYNDCDERGDENLFILHWLLISKEQADTILHALYDPEGTHIPGFYADLEELFHYKYFTAYPYMERFGYEHDGSKATVNLTKVLHYNRFQERYKEMLVPMAQRLTDALKNVQKVFSPVFTPHEVPAPNVQIAPTILQRIMAGNYHRFEVQHLSDFLADLMHAYLEFVENAFDLIADCPADPNRFPKHLFVRFFDETATPVNSPASVYRTPYTQPPIYNGNRARKEEVRALYQRLREMAMQYATPSLLGNNEIRITPSRLDASPLSQRAMPFYYPPSLKEWWNPRRRRMGRSGQVYSYHRPPMPPYNDPLTFHIEGSDFLRIEGHIGKDFNDAMGQLSDIRMQYNLPFQIVALKLGEKYTDELFQFDCCDLDCEKEKLLADYDQERKILLDHLQNYLSPTAQTPAATLAKTLADTLEENLSEFNFQTFEAAFDPFQAYTQFNPQTKETFRHLSDCYKKWVEREEKTRKRHLFHFFADAYPGMEHGSGVPLGGTFVLVYVDPGIVSNEISQLKNYIETLPLDGGIKNTLLAKAEASRLVVGDFYLPYACISCCPPICYVIHRPAPVLSITPLVFCLGDTTPRPLTVLAYPSGGELLGPGYSFNNGEHFFTPADAGLPTGGTVALRYVVNGTEAVVNLTILAPPLAEFGLYFENGEAAPSSICVDRGPLKIVPAAGVPLGTLKANIGNIAQPDALDGVTFYPDKLTVALPVEVSIEHAVLVPGNICAGKFTRTILVNPLPDGDFTITVAGSSDDIKEVCNDAGQVKFTPLDTSGTSVFAVFIVNDSGVLEQLTNNAILGGDTLLLSAFNAVFENADQIQVVIRHTKTSTQGCQVVFEKNLTIWKLIQPTLTLPAAVCVNAPPFTLNSDVAGGTFYFRLAGTAAPWTAILGNTFDPMWLNDQTLPANVVIRQEVSNGPCTSFAEGSIQVTPVPDPDFDAKFAEPTNQDTIHRT